MCYPHITPELQTKNLHEKAHLVYTLANPHGSEYFVRAATLTPRMQNRARDGVLAILDTPKGGISHDCCPVINCSRTQLLQDLLDSFSLHRHIAVRIVDKRRRI